MFAEQRLPGAPAPALYVRARGTYTALVRGPGAETSAHHTRLVERGLRVFAASLDRVEDEMNGDGEDDARMSLVPGCAAFEAAMCARLRDAVDDAAAADATPDEKSSFDDEGVDREARVMALEVTRAMSRGARAVGAEHGGARETSRAGTGRGGAGTARRWSDGIRLSDATRTFDRTNAKLPREARPPLARVRVASRGRFDARRSRVRGERAGGDASGNGGDLIVRRPRTLGEEKPRASRSSRARSIPRNTPRSNRRARRSARYCGARGGGDAIRIERRCPPRFDRDRRSAGRARGRRAAATEDDARGECSSSENRRTSRTKSQTRATTTTGGTTTRKTERRRRKLASSTRRSTDELVYY